MTQRALVTGGAGFIGSHLVDRLIDEGWAVDLVDNLISGHREFINPCLKKESIIIDDFSSIEVMNRISNGKYDYVFHLAAIPRVSYSVEHPLTSHETNVTKSLQLIHACKGNIKRFIFASSSSVYGGAYILPTRESYSKNPKSPYALQKSIIEDYLSQYWHHYGLESSSLRFFNVFGPRQLGGSPYSTAVSSWLTSIKKGESMRSDGDGSQSRDICYVDNVVDACYKAATVKNEMTADCYNVACGDRITNLEILQYLQKRYPAAEWHSSHWRPGDVMHTQADLSHSAQNIGYKPLVRFWEGLERTIDWYESNWDAVKNYESKRC
jgi:nucleoside-diphosphate-sugar epimerase